MLEGAWMCHSLHLDAEHVGHIGVWAAEANIPSPGQRGLSAIAQNIDIGEARVESHRTQLATVRVEIEGISELPKKLTLNKLALIGEAGKSP